MALAACQPAGPGDGTPLMNKEAPPAEEIVQGTPQGKPTAPIRIEYSVIGAAFVGQPVNIEIDVSSTVRDRSITLEYRVNDPRDLAFADSQPQRVSLSAIGDAPAARRQVVVVPKREGRLFLNVSAEIETEEGSLIRAISIPVQVGAARQEREANGERKKDPDGETVISMPADES